MRIDGPNGPHRVHGGGNNGSSQPIRRSASSPPPKVEQPEISRQSEITNDIIEQLDHCCEWMRQHGKQGVSQGVRVRTDVGKAHFPSDPQ